MNYSIEGFTFDQVSNEIMVKTAEANQTVIDTTIGDLIAGYQGGRTLVGNGNQFTLTPNGFSQLWVDRLGFPVRSADMLSPELQIAVATELAGKNSSSPVKVLASGGNVDAVLSAEYQPIPNSAIALMLDGALPSDSTVHRWNLSKDCRTLDLRVVSPTWKVALGGKRPDPGFAGLHIQNNELGAGSFVMKLCVARVACFNYVISSHVVIEQEHRWFSPKELMEAMATGIGRIPQYAEEVAEEMREWRKVPVHDPALAFERVGEVAGVPQYALNDATTFWKENGSEHNLFAVTQALAHGTKALVDVTGRRRVNWNVRNQLEEAIWTIGQTVREEGEEHWYTCPACHQHVEVEAD